MAILSYMGDPGQDPSPRLLETSKKPKLLGWNPTEPDSASAIPIEVPLSHPTGEPPSTPHAGNSLGGEPTIVHPKKADFGLFVGILGILLAIMFPIMQGNGVVINWEWSMIAYTAIVVGFVWTFLTHAVPNRKPIPKIVGSIGGAVILGWLGIIGVRTQYRAQHPGIPMPAVVIQTFPGLPEGIQDSSHLRWNVLLIRNDNDIEIENFYGRIQLPEPIMTTIESNLPPGVAIDWEPLLTKFAIKGAGNRTNLGPGTAIYPIYRSPTLIFPVYSAQLTEFSDGGFLTGVWQLLIDKLPPHKTAAISFLTTDEGDATNYIALANYEFKTNGATVMAVVQGTTNGSTIIHKSLIAFIIHTNKEVEPNEDWRLGPNELRYSFEGTFQYGPTDKGKDQHFLVPFAFETNNRTISSLPIQAENGKWKRVSIEYQ